MKGTATPHSPSTTLATFSVAGIIAAILLRAFGGPDILAALLLVAAGALVYSGFHLIPPRLRNTGLLLLGLTVVLLPFAESPLAAIRRGLFISGLLLALISSVLLLAQCALRNPRVQQVGSTLRAQSSAKRYPSFTVASHLFSSMLGMAGAHVMLLMAAPQQEPNGPEKTEAVVGVTRGFATAGLWSPVYGNMVTLLALYPVLDWMDVFPVGFLLAQLALLVGVWLNWRDACRFPRQPGVRTGRSSTAELARDAIPLLLPLLAFMALLLTVSRLLGIVVSAVIVLLAPLIALTIHLGTGAPGRRWAHALTNLRESTNNFPRLASEALVLIAAGCAGSIMADVFPAQWAGHIGIALAGLPFFGLAFLLVAILLMALVGVHPVLSAVFLASTITPDLLDLAPVAHMAALLTGWGLSAVLTPFSVLTLTAARYSGTSLYQISFGKNWLFTLLTGTLACGVLSIVNLLMR